MTDFERDLHERLHAARLPEAPPTLIRALDEIVRTREPSRHRRSRPLALLMVAAVIAASGILVASGAMDPEPTDDQPPPTRIGSRPRDADVPTHAERRRRRSRPGSMGSTSTRCPSCNRLAQPGTSPADRSHSAATGRTSGSRTVVRPPTHPGRTRDLLPRRGVRHHRAERAGRGPDQGFPARARHGPDAHPVDPERGLGRATRIAPARQRTALPAGPDRRRRPPRRRARSGVPTQAAAALPRSVRHRPPGRASSPRRSDARSHPDTFAIPLRFAAAPEPRPRRVRRGRGHQRLQLPGLDGW